MLVKCHECNGSVSETASACPHCGAKLDPREASPEKDRCPLCGLRKADKSYEIEIRKEGKREYAIGGRIDHYWKRNVTFFLCSECHTLLSREESIKAIINLIGFIGCFVYGFVLTDDWRSSLLAGVTFAGLWCVCAYYFLGLIFKGEKRIKKTRYFKELMDDGWDL